MENSTNQNINIDNIDIRRPLDKKEYAKKYYTEHKEKMMEQTRLASKSDKSKERKREKTINKLNTNSFKRIPLKTLNMLNILWNDEEKKYI